MIGRFRGVKKGRSSMGLRLPLPRYGGPDEIDSVVDSIVDRERMMWMIWRREDEENAV